jgi:hypothetical protein
MCALHRLHPPIGFVAQPRNHSPLGFKAQTKNPPQWFWGLNHQSIAAGFKAQTEKPNPVVLRPNHWQTVDLDFEAKPRNPCFSSPCAQYRPHTTSHDLLIIRPPSTRPMLDHPQSSAPGLLLLPWPSSLTTMSHLSPAQHETCKHDSLHRIEGRVEPRKLFEFKFTLRQVNYSSHIKPRYWPLGFSISPLMSTLTTKSTKFEIWIQDPWSTTRRPKSQRKT